MRFGRTCRLPRLCSSAAAGSDGAKKPPFVKYRMQHANLLCGAVHTIAHNIVHNVKINTPLGVKAHTRAREQDTEILYAYWNIYARECWTPNQFAVCTQLLPLSDASPPLSLAWTNRTATMVVLSSSCRCSIFSRSASQMPEAVGQRRAILSAAFIVNTSQRPSVAMSYTVLDKGKGNRRVRGEMNDRKFLIHTHTAPHPNSLI